ASVGSANVDMRSFDLNFEIAAMIYDEDFAARLLKVFYIDVARSIEVKPDEWNKRKKTERYKESIARIFGPLY
ncbi:MAG TPA: cardiolipin synthase, partial [Bacteroidales bacterium]|nr:cardiolipin synthase [Bacteroidales bacterium]